MSASEARKSRANEARVLTPSEYLASSRQMHDDDVVNKKGTFFSKMPVGPRLAAGDAVVEPSSGARLAGRLQTKLKT